MRKFIFLLPGILAWSSLLNAQQRFESLESVWDYAQANNKGVMIKGLETDQARDDSRTASSFLLPTVSAGFNGQYNIDIAETPVPGELMNQPGETVYLKFGKAYNYNAGLSFSYDLLDWQSVYQAKIAGTNFKLKEAGEELYRQNLKEQVAQVYYAALTAGKAVDISRSDLATADSLLALSKERFSQGLGDALAVNQSAMYRNRIDQNLQRNISYREQCLDNLRTLTGIPAGEALLLDGSLSPENMESTNPDLPENTRYTEIYRLQLQMMDQEAAKATAAFAPKIGFRGYLGEVQYQDSFTLSFEGRDWRPSNYIGMTVVLPLFTGFANYTHSSSARVGREIARQQYEDEQRKAVISDSTLLKAYKSTQAIAVSAGENFRISGESLELARQKYEEGLSSLDAYLQAFNDYLDTEGLYLNSLSEFLTNKAIIESRK